MKKAFVIGHPIAHSLSPLLHGYWLEKYKIEGRYDAINVFPDELNQFVTRLRSGEFVGGNVTLPHKHAIFGLCDEIETDTRIIGAVNTLIMRDNKLVGSNTDQLGFAANLDQMAPGWDKKKGEAIVLGAGGAARAVLVALASRGISHIHILNRTAQKAIDLANELPGPFSGHALTHFTQLASDAQILVNTSSIGMHGTRFEDLPLNNLPRSALVTDIVYTPLITPLLKDAQKAGLKTVDGLGMLLHQAVPGFKAWFGTRPEVTTELRELLINKLRQS